MVKVAFLTKNRNGNFEDKENRKMGGVHSSEAL